MCLDACAPACWSKARSICSTRPASARGYTPKGLRHDGFSLAFDGRLHRIDLAALTGGKHVTVYGQTEVTRDLMEAATPRAATHYEVANVVAARLRRRAAPFVTFEKDGATRRIDCDFIAGCDGYHGVSRRVGSGRALHDLREGLSVRLAGRAGEVPPADGELVYANHERGFALCSMRSPTRSRYYIQCRSTKDLRTGATTRFWDELRRRLPARSPTAVTTGPSFEKSIAPLRSFVAEPMRFGRLLLVGDAAHIVPPTGAKGLNLAASDVHYLFHGAAGVLPRQDRRPGSTPIPAARWRASGRRCASPGG